MKQTPTRKTDAWGTLVSVRRAVLQQWYPLLDARRQEERTRKNLGHPSRATRQAAMSTAASGPIPVNATTVALDAVANARVGSNGMSIYSTSIGEGQSATIVEPTAVLAREVPLAGKIIGWASNLLDAKIVLDGITYLWAEGRCALGK